MNKHFKKLMSLVVLAICIFSFSGCNLYSFNSKYPGYSKFLLDRHLYGDYTSPPQESIVPKISTYSPIINDCFTNAIVGESDFIYVEKNNERFILNSTNQFFSVPKDLKVLSLNGKYAITEKNSKKGISILPDLREIVPHSYSSVQVIGDTFLVIEGIKTTIYYKEMVTLEVSSISIDIYMNGIIVSNNSFCDVYNNKLSYKDYPIVAIYDNGDFIYETIQGYGIFYNGKEIPGFYSFASMFKNGRASVTLSNGENAVIDINGNILFKTKGGRIFDFNDGYHLHNNGNKLSILDSDFELYFETDYAFVYDSRIFNNYIVPIYNKTYSFINIHTMKNEGTFTQLSKMKNDFIAKDGTSKFSIFSSELEYYRTGIEEVFFSQTKLAAKIDGKFYLYKKGEQS